MAQPAVGEDVTALMGGDEPAIGEDVSALMGGEVTPDVQTSFLRRFFGDMGGRTVDPELGRQVQDAMGGTPVGAAVQGVTEGALNALMPVAASAAAKGASALGKRISKPLMRAALGAQQGLRRKFPTVDLEGVALREGVTVPDAAKVSELARQANQGVSAAGRAADAAGAPKVQPRELTGGLRKLYDRAGQARMPEDQAQIVEEANRLRKLYRGGASVEDALVGKSARQTAGRSALQGAADPRAAATASKIDAAVGRALGDAAKSRSPEVSAALTRSQELMALDKAMQTAATRTPTLRNVVGGAAGAAAGLATGDVLTGLGTAAATHVLTDPRALSILAQGVERFADPSARAAARAILVGLMSSQATEGPTR